MACNKRNIDGMEIFTIQISLYCNYNMTNVITQENFMNDSSFFVINLQFLVINLIII